MPSVAELVHDGGDAGAAGSLGVTGVLVGVGCVRPALVGAAGVAGSPHAAGGAM